MKIQLKSVRLDGGTQPRQFINEDVVNDYSEQMLDDNPFLEKSTEDTETEAMGLSQSDQATQRDEIDHERDLQYRESSDTPADANHESEQGPDQESGWDIKWLDHPEMK